MVAAMGSRCLCWTSKAHCHTHPPTLMSPVIKNQHFHLTHLGLSVPLRVSAPCDPLMFLHPRPSPWLRLLQWDSATEGAGNQSETWGAWLMLERPTLIPGGDESWRISSSLVIDHLQMQGFFCSYLTCEACANCQDQSPTGLLLFLPPHHIPTLLPSSLSFRPSQQAFWGPVFGAPSLK